MKRKEQGGRGRVFIWSTQKKRVVVVGILLTNLTIPRTIVESDF